MRAILVRLEIACLNVLAVLGAVAALLPLLLRRRPLGHRTPIRRSEARVIALPRGRSSRS